MLTLLSFAYGYGYNGMKVGRMDIMFFESGQEQDDGRKEVRNMFGYLKDNGLEVEM